MYVLLQDMVLLPTRSLREDLSHRLVFPHHSLKVGFLKAWACITSMFLLFVCLFFYMHIKSTSISAIAIWSLQLFLSTYWVLEFETVIISTVSILSYRCPFDERRWEIRRNYETEKLLGSSSTCLSCLFLISFVHKDRIRPRHWKNLKTKCLWGLWEREIMALSLQTCKLGTCD